MKALIVLLAVAVLGGCAGLEHRAKMNWDAEYRRTQFENRCANYGYTRGTPSFAVCIQAETLARRARAAAAAAAQNAAIMQSHGGGGTILSPGGLLQKSNHCPIGQSRIMGVCG